MSLNVASTTTSAVITSTTANASMASSTPRRRGADLASPAAVVGKEIKVPGTPRRRAPRCRTGWPGTSGSTGSARRSCGPGVGLAPGRVGRGVGVAVGLGAGLGHSGFCWRSSRAMICSASVRLSAGMPSCTWRRGTCSEVVQPHRVGVDHRVEVQRAERGVDPAVDRDLVAVGARRSTAPGSSATGRSRRRRRGRAARPGPSASRSRRRRGLAGGSGAVSSGSGRGLSVAARDAGVVWSGSRCWRCRRTRRP